MRGYNHIMNLNTDLLGWSVSVDDQICIFFQITVAQRQEIATLDAHWYSAHVGTAMKSFQWS